MRVGDKLWMNWNKAPMRLWQSQLNFAVWCASSACGVSSEHLNYTKHPMFRAVYRFHVYYHVRRVLKRLQVPLPHGPGFNTSNNPYTESEFLKICEGNCGAPNDPMKYRDKRFYWTYQRSVRWPDDYIGPDSMTRWIIEKSDGFTDVGLFRISESVRAYAYLILSSQASARSSIVGNTVSALTTQGAFLNNFENVVNRRVNIQEDIKRYQDTISYTSSKVDYSIGENIYMLPRDMNLNIRSGTVEYNNKILVSDGKFSLGKNVEVNAPRAQPPQAPGPAMKYSKINSLEPITIESHSTTAQGLAHAPTISHEEEKIALILFLTGGFTIWFLF